MELDDAYCERILKEQQENDIEYWKKENERLREVIEKQNKKLNEITNAVVNNCRPKQKIIDEIWNIVMNRV